MAPDLRIIDKKEKHDLNIEGKKYSHYHLAKSINMSTLRVEKYCLLNKVEL